MSRDDKAPTVPQDAAPIDLYALPPDAIKEPPQSLWTALRQIGPGLILAGSIVGTGELIATTHLGAKAGFALMWLVLVSCFIKVFVQVELGRHAVSSGETILTSFTKLPGPGFLFGWWWLIMMLSTQAQLATMVGGVGQAAHLALPSVAEALGTSPETPWAVVAAVSTALLLVAGSYGVVEKASTWLVVAFTMMTVLSVIMLPAGSITAADLQSGMTFQIPPEAVMAALMMFGITGVGGSELIAYPYWCIEKGYARNVGPKPGVDAKPEEHEGWLRRAKGWLSVMKLDAWFCMGVYTVATIAFYLLGAAVLHKSTGGEGLPGSIGAMLSALTQMYVPALGAKAALWFMVIGAFAVLYSTLISATAANCRALADFLHVNNIVTFTHADDRRRWIRIFSIAFPALYLVVYLIGRNPVVLVSIGGIAQALTLPMIASAAVYMRYKRTDRRITPGLIWDAFLWLSMIGLTGAALYGLYDVYQKITG